MEEADLREFQVVFTSQTCDVCGATGHISEPCGCGATEAGPDPHVDRRRILLQPLETWDWVDDGADLGIGDVLETLDDWIPVLFAQADDVGARDGDPTVFIEHVAVLRRIRVRMGRVGLLRPWIAIWGPLTHVVDHLLDMATVYIEALTAATPAEAEACASQAQESLNKAAEAIGALSRRLDRWNLPGTVRLPDSAVRHAVVAYEVTGAVNLTDLDLKGRPLYQRITGRTTAPTGIGVGLLLDVGHAEDAFDDQRFWDVAGLAYRRIDERRGQFRKLLADPAWLANIRTTRSQFYNALLKAETLLDALSNDRRMEVDAALELGATLTEMVGPGVLRVLVGDAKRPSEVLKRDYTSILQMAHQAGLDALLLGFDRDIRNADAHHDYEILDDSVVLSGDYPRTVPDEALIDIVLSALESSAALFAALDCALIEEGVAATLDRVDELSVEDLLRILLAANGVVDATVDLRRDHVEIRGRTLVTVTPKPLMIMASLVPSIPGAITRARIALRCATGTVVARGPLAPFRRFFTNDGLAKEAAVVELLARWTLGRRPVASNAQVRFWAAIRAASLVDVGVEEADNALGILAMLGRRLQDRALVEAAEGMRAVKFAATKGNPSPTQAREHMLKFTVWLKARPGPIGDGSPPGPPGVIPA